MWSFGIVDLRRLMPKWFRWMCSSPLLKGLCPFESTLNMARACSYLLYRSCGLRVIHVVDKGEVLWKFKFVKDEFLNLS